MNDAKPLTQRIDDCEARIAYQDDTIETLSATVTAQWKQIEALTRQIAMLTERVQLAETNAPEVTNETPPHY